MILTILSYHKICDFIVVFLKFLLFNGDALGKISWLVHIKTFSHRHIVTQQLKGNDGEYGGEMFIGLGYIQGEVHIVFYGVIPIGSDTHKISATALTLQ